MKKNYTKPVIMAEEFIPQEYCANCSGDDYTKTTYKFVCDGGESFWFGNSVYLETNGIEGLQTSGDNADTRQSSSYSPCNESHTVEVTGKLTEANLDAIFPKGYIVRNTWGGETEVTPVRVWTANGTNTHCTEALSINQFQLAKS